MTPGMNRLIGALLVVLCCSLSSDAARAGESFADAIEGNQPKMVKVYGAGGLGGLEPYQSGFVISAAGHIATAWSYVLDTDYITVTLADGRRLEAKLVGADPRLELAILKVEADDVPHFDLAAAATAFALARRGRVLVVGGAGVAIHLGGAVRGWLSAAPAAAGASPRA